MNNDLELTYLKIISEDNQNSFEKRIIKDIKDFKILTDNESYLNIIKKTNFETTINNLKGKSLKNGLKIIKARIKGFKETKPSNGTQSSKTDE